MSTPRALKPCFVVLDPITPKANVEFSAELKRAINERNMLTTKTRKRVTEALEEIQSECEEGNRRIKKQKLLAEIFESEENYIKQLETIIKYFIKPTKEKDLLSREAFAILFGNVESIYKINKELLHELRRGPANVARAFSKIAPFFKSYSFYAFEFKKSLEILQNCQKCNPKFAKFLENQESRPEVQSKLSALLITPIQRVPRYRLLIKPLFNLTSPSEEDYDSLSDSLSKIENAANHINKILGERENMQRLLEVQRCLKNGELSVITPGRSLIKEGQLLKVDSNDGHGKRMYVVLTNDIIMFCKMKNQNLKPNSLTCSAIYPLNKCKVVEILDKGSFRLICQDNEIVLYHKSLSETREWIDEIKSAIQIHVEDRKTLRKESSSRRPVKRKDLREYNEVGISPGKRLKKKRSSYEENENQRDVTYAKKDDQQETSYKCNGDRSEKPTSNGRLALSCRKPIRFNTPTRESFQNYGYTSPVFSTLRPRDIDNNGIQRNHEVVPSRDVFVFGRQNPDRGFSFRMNNWFCGVGSSVKKFFGFNTK